MNILASIMLTIIFGVIFLWILPSYVAKFVSFITSSVCLLQISYIYLLFDLNINTYQLSFNY